MSNRFLSVVAVSFTLAAGSWAVASGAAELDDTSVKLFNMQKAAAERDSSPQAQYYLAQMYEHGLGTEEDMNKAREFYQKAADKGLTVAKLQLKEIERAEKDAQLDRQRAAERAANASQAQAHAKASNAKVATAIDEDSAEAARRAEREKARAERKRRAMEVLRKATAAAKAGNPFGDE